MLAIVEHFNKAMRKACPSSRSNEYINLWSQIIVNNLVLDRTDNSRIALPHGRLGRRRPGCPLSPTFVLRLAAA
uniref:Uncharacterized protein n=1 Tax=Oryza barthii TaxID=65489 RepID=A0A0D3F6B6_9ORYZ